MSRLPGKPESGFPESAVPKEAAALGTHLAVRYRHTLVALALLALTLAVFWRAVGFDFLNYDDNNFITNNARIQQGLTTAGIGWALTTLYQNFYHPVTWLSYLADYQLYKLDPFGYHLTNLLFHLANVLLLFLVLLRLTSSPSGNPKSEIRNPKWARCAFVAALFAIHPLHVESVAWIAQRKDVLSTFFWILTMWAYLVYVRRPDARRYAVLIVVFALGLASKSMLVTLPFVLLLLDYWPLDRFTGRPPDVRHPKAVTSGTNAGLLVEKIPLFALSALFCFLSFTAQKAGGAVSSLSVLPIGTRVANALVSYIVYIRKMLWPVDLAVYYPHPGTSLPVWQGIAAGLLLLALSILIVRASRRRPYLGVGWFWYVGTLVPVLGLVQVGSFAMADRYTYVSLIGLFIMIAWGVPDLIRTPNTQHLTPNTLSPSPTLPLAIVILLLLSALAYRQVGYWQNSITLFEHALAVTPDNYTARVNLGEALEVSDRVDEAIRHDRRALELDPRGEKAYNNLGIALERAGRRDEAIACYRKALEINPDNAEANGNLALALSDAGRVNDAGSHYAKLVERSPDDPNAHYQYARALASQGNIGEAIKQLREAVRLKPDFAEAHYALGLTYKQQGNSESAMRAYRDAIRVDKDHSEAHNNLANILLVQRRYDEAIREYREAIRSKPGNTEAHNNLAAALYYNGDYAQAWKQVHILERHGGKASPALLRMLSERMPDTGAN